MFIGCELEQHGSSCRATGNLARTKNEGNTRPHTTTKYQPVLFQKLGIEKLEFLGFLNFLPSSNLSPKKLTAAAI